MQQNNPRARTISSNRPDSARLFFALWPDADQRRQLAAIASASGKRYGGRLMRAETLHITLLFVGAIPRGQIPALELAAGIFRFDAFDLSLDRVACWRHNRIAYAAPSVSPEALGNLVMQLRHSVEQAGIDFDRKPFVPHLTLLRNIERNFDTYTMPPLVWRVSSFALVESVPTERGARYQTLRVWPCED